MWPCGTLVSSGPPGLQEGALEGPWWSPARCLFWRVYPWVEGAPASSFFWARQPLTSLPSCVSPIATPPGPWLPGSAGGKGLHWTAACPRESSTPRPWAPGLTLLWGVRIPGRPGHPGCSHRCGFPLAWLLLPSCPSLPPSLSPHILSSMGSPRHPSRTPRNLLPESGVDIGQVFVLCLAGQCVATAIGLVCVCVCACAPAWGCQTFLQC